MDWLFNFVADIGDKIRGSIAKNFLVESILEGYHIQMECDGDEVVVAIDRTDLIWRSHGC